MKSNFFYVQNRHFPMIHHRFLRDDSLFGPYKNFHSLVAFDKRYILWMKACLSAFSGRAVSFSQLWYLESNVRHTHTQHKIIIISVMRAQTQTPSNFRFNINVFLRSYSLWECLLCVLKDDVGRLFFCDFLKFMRPTMMI